MQHLAIDSQGRDGCPVLLSPRQPTCSRDSGAAGRGSLQLPGAQPPSTGSYRALGTSTGPSRPPPARAASLPPNFSSIAGAPAGLPQPPSPPPPPARGFLILRAMRAGQKKRRDPQARLGPQRNRKRPAQHPAATATSSLADGIAHCGRGRERGPVTGGTGVCCPSRPNGFAQAAPLKKQWQRHLSASIWRCKKLKSPLLRLSWD